MPANRSDGAPRRRHAAVRADEAGGTERSPNRRQPYAAVQLRQDNLAGDHYSLVGFQTQLKWGEQARVLRMIPGSSRPSSCGSECPSQHLHQRPTVLPRRGRPAATRHVFAGQISVSRDTSSRRVGPDCRRNAAALVRSEVLRVPPRTTAIGALAFYVSHANPHDYQPTNITFVSWSRRPAHSRQAEA